jgi:large subunit ribosomal protein L17
MNRTSEHVRSMVRNMVVNLLRHERIRTTVKKAKLVRPYAEKMITLGKKGTLHAKRQALAFLRSKPAVVKLFRNVAPRYEERNGGYTRILRLAEAIRPASSDKVADFEVPAGSRLGDGTPMAIFELVEGEVRPREKRRRAAPEPYRPRRELHREAEQADERAEAGEAAEETPDEGPSPEGSPSEEPPTEDDVPEGGAGAPSE